MGRVSASGLLKIWVDDELKLERELPCGEGLGKDSVYRPQWKLWETTYDEDVAVDIPAGTHRIRVENLGRDWVTVGSYRFTGCQVLDRPNVLVCGMKTDPAGRPLAPEPGELVVQPCPRRRAACRCVSAGRARAAGRAVRRRVVGDLER